MLCIPDFVKYFTEAGYKAMDIANTVCTIKYTMLTVTWDIICPDICFEGIELL